MRYVFSKRISGMKNKEEFIMSGVMFFIAVVTLVGGYITMELVEWML